MANRPKKSKEVKASNADIFAEFSEAVGETARRSAVSDISRNREEVVTDDDMWLEQHLLTFTEFCAHPDHMNFPPLSEKQAAVAEYMLGPDPRRTFDVKRTLACLIFGKGGGKDRLSCLIQLYLVYLLLNLRNPQRYLAQDDQSSLDMYNVACAKDQAETVYFMMLKTHVLNWKWLREKWDCVVNGRFFVSQTEKTVEEDYFNKVTITNDAILFPKNIRCFSGSSESESLEGKNVLCFEGNTKVSLASGMEVEIKDLIGLKNFYVYSYDGTKVITAKAHSVRKTREDTPLVRVVLNNDKFVRCTPDHLFMLKDGTYRQAEKLLPGEGLMSSSAKDVWVISVTPDGTSDVYDLTVDETHNFALTAGVFVHNCYVIDEADAFKQESATRSAEKIWRTMASSSNSRFRGKQKGFVISWPRSKNGFIMKLYKKTLNMLSVYSDISPTWEAKPRHLFSPDTFDYEGRQIPMDFYEDFRLDPLGSLACYCCEPPDAQSPFIEDFEKVDVATANIKQLFEFKDIYTNEYVQKVITRSPFMHDRSIKYVMGFDLSETRDYTALAIAHREGDKILFDTLTCWIPDRKKKISVDLQNFEEVINNIRRDITIDKISSDPWNSSLMVQKLHGQGMNARKVNLTLEDYELFKRLLYARQIVLPKNEMLIKELKNLQLVDGRKIDHLNGFHNDMSSAVVMCVKSLLEMDKAEGSSGLLAEGEYVGENIYEAVDAYDQGAEKPREGLEIDGIIIADYNQTRRSGYMGGGF